MKVVYIAGLARSGSTFLQLLLSSHTEIVGLGEIAQTLENLNTLIDQSGKLRLCSCGLDILGCSFWGPVAKRLEHASIQKAHHEILERFKNEFPERLLVDSSKSRKHLKNLYVENLSLSDVELKIIFLVRDFRGWALSYARHARMQTSGAFWYLINSYRWFYANLKLMRYLRTKKTDFLCVSYERLVFDTTRQLKRITDFLSVPYQSKMINMDSATAHDVFGNVMKNDPSRRTRILYDDSWIRDWRPSVLTPFLLPVHWFNHVFYGL